MSNLAPADPPSPWQSQQHQLVVKTLALNLKLGRYLALKSLQNGPQSMTNLSMIAGISTAGMTCIRDTMMREGLIGDARSLSKNHEHFVDRRNVWVSLTPKGAEVVAAFEEKFMSVNLQHPLCGLCDDVLRDRVCEAVVNGKPCQVHSECAERVMLESSQSKLQTP